MTTGQLEAYIATVFNFGHRTTVAAGTSTYLPGTGGTNQAAEIALIIPRNGTLKNLRWDCQSNGLTGATSRFIVRVGGLHASPTSPAPALSDALTVSLAGGLTSGADPFGLPVTAGQRVAVHVQATGGSNISRLRVSFELEAQRASPTWQLDSDGSTVFYDGGNVGIGTTTPGEMLTVAGMIESTVGGFKFPDDSVQTTAAFGGAGGISSLQGPSGTPAFALVADDNGRIGIGTTTPQEKLALSQDSSFAIEMATPVLLSADPATGGALPPATYYFKIVAEDGAGGTTAASNEQSTTINPGSGERSCELSWIPVQGAASYRVYIGDDGSGTQDRFYRATSSTKRYIYAGESTAEPWEPVPTVTTAYVNRLSAAGPSWVLGGKLGIGTANPQANLDVNGTISGIGIVPIGSIIAWHKSLAGTPALPDGWAECNGQIVKDAASPYNGRSLPDLNGERRFLRGSAASGTMQADAFQGHFHEVENGRGGDYYGGTFHMVLGDDTYNTARVRNPVSDGVNGTPRTASETRPINMSVVWIIRIK